MVQFTDGTLGPKPDTITGLNRKEDLSVALVPLERLQNLDASDKPSEEPGPEVSYLVRDPDGTLSKPMSLKDALSTTSNLLSKAEGGDSVGIRKRQRAG